MKHTYVLSTLVTGTFESVILADSEEEAVRLFNEEIINHNFGRLQDVEWVKLDVEDEHPDYN